MLPQRETLAADSPDFRAAPQRHCAKVCIHDLGFGSKCGCLYELSEQVTENYDRTNRISIARAFASDLTLHASLLGPPRGI